MIQNTNGIERVIRIALGAALIGGAATQQIGVWGYIGVVPLLTGVAAFCPAYALFGFSTKKSS